MNEFSLTIQSTLEAYQIPGGSSAYFAKVYKGEPSALMPTTGRALARWRVLRSERPPEGARTLKSGGDRQTVVVFGISCYWPLTPAEAKQESQEDDIAAVLVDLPNEFIALTPSSYTIGGYPLAAITVEDVSSVDRMPPFPESPADMRILTFELHARILEAS